MYLLIVLLLAVPAVASCPDGFTEYGKGVCVDGQKPQGDAPTYKVTDEKPPRHPEPAWQRGDVVIDQARAGVLPSTTTAHNYKAEEDEK